VHLVLFDSLPQSLHRRIYSCCCVLRLPLLQAGVEKLALGLYVIRGDNM